MGNLLTTPAVLASIAIRFLSKGSMYSKYMYIERHKSSGNVGVLISPSEFILQR